MSSPNPTRPWRSLAASAWVFWLLLVTAGLLAAAVLEDGHGWGDDFASYIMQAQSLVDGRMDEFVAQNRFTIENSNLTLGPVAYPWGTPLLLAPIVVLWGNDPLALKGLNVASLLGFLAVLWFGFRPRLSPGWGLLYFLLFAFNPYLYWLLNQLLSELPFLLFSSLAVLLLRRTVVEERRLISRGFDRLLLGLMVGLAATIRTNGILLLGCVLLAQAVHNASAALPAVSGPETARLTGRQRLSNWLSAARPATWKEALVQALPLLAFGVFSLAWMAVFPDSGLSQFSVFSRIKITTILYHFYYYFIIPSEFLTPLNHNWLLFAVFAALTAWGILRRARQDYDDFIYCLLTVGFYIFWPPLQGLRFLLPIMPLVLLFTFAGLQAGIERLQPEWRRPVERASAVMLALLVGFFFFTIFQTASHNLQAGRVFNDGPYTPATQEVFTFLRQQAAPGQIAAFIKPRALRLFTGLKTFASTDPAMLAQADYLVQIANPGPHPVQQLDTATLVEWLNQGRLELLFEADIFQVYAVRQQP